MVTPNATSNHPTLPGQLLNSLVYPITDESALIGALEALPTRIVSNWSGNRNIEYEAGRGTIGVSMVLQRPPHPPPRYSKVVCIREQGSMGRHARPGWSQTLKKYVKIDIFWEQKRPPASTSVLKLFWYYYYYYYYYYFVRFPQFLVPLTISEHYVQE